MKNRIQLLDIAIDIDSTKVAAETTIQCLEEESSKVIYFVNSETLLLLQENEDWKDVVEATDLTLPGNAGVNNSVDEELGHKRDPFFFDGYFEQILDYAISVGAEILLVTESEERFLSVQESLHAKRPYLTLSGLYLTEQEESLDHIVNEINSVAPDILLIALEEQRQLELLQNYRDKMNAGLALFTGKILYNQAVAEAEVPESIQKLKMDNIYKWSQKDGRIRNFFNNLKMKFRIRQQRKDKES